MRSPFESSLIEWGRSNLPAAVSAIDQLPHDRRWRDRCLAAIFRARADVDVAWLFGVVEAPDATDVRRLAPLIVRAAGYPVRGTFGEWVDNVRHLAGVEGQRWDEAPAAAP